MDRVTTNQYILNICSFNNAGDMQYIVDAGAYIGANIVDPPKIIINLLVDLPETIYP